ncbi:DUF5316 domain-containing protein [Clostridium folliculivorans]|uniref:DUF5316 domain-containing protein n=1 Tax=Clostridium folliculivorans TaxID=2886038 RepID=A0A9W5Y2D8_9CLOT|nr:DUF5316 domain-containing protein [Clostridium folliculivorans]GKU25464.1 hypothetical protein CFOLD11_22900 [Clostridium folliculivorans]GKU28486.1 hypothetical protein CFB3_05920 [Clostridium folliculivorans]
MRKSIILSLILIYIGVVAGFLQNDWYLTVRICGISGLVCLSISGLLNGAFNGFIKGPGISSGRRISPPILDTNEANPVRDKITNFLIVVGGPNVITAIVVYVLTNKK